MSGKYKVKTNKWVHIHSIHHPTVQKKYQFFGRRLLKCPSQIEKHKCQLNYRNFVSVPFFGRIAGHFVSLLHMRQLWATALFLFTLYIFRMQRPAHSRSFRNQATQYRTRIMLWNDLLSCVQRFHLRSRMLCNGTKTFTKRGEVMCTLQQQVSSIQFNQILLFLFSFRQKLK